MVKSFGVGPSVLLHTVCLVLPPGHLLWLDYRWGTAADDVDVNASGCISMQSTSMVLVASLDSFLAMAWNGAREEIRKRALPHMVVFLKLLIIIGPRGQEAKRYDPTTDRRGSSGGEGKTRKEMDRMNSLRRRNGSTKEQIARTGFRLPSVSFYGIRHLCDDETMDDTAGEKREARRRLIAKKSVNLPSLWTKYGKVEVRVEGVRERRRDDFDHDYGGRLRFVSALL
ncbi:MAG: hypothetical protein M1827_000457 [Pycnora praestabilis]|nr:MAG: hypothetical protein M1827_000457 [Pycnora praestabilis]